jgi:dTDP-glucose pyrophosphorylase
MIRIKEELEKLTALPTETIKDCMVKIDKNKKGSLIIIDEKSTLLGTLSDGDIRRAILKGRLIDSDINSIYNNQPIKYLDHELDSISFEILQERKISIVPIVNESNVLIGIQSAEKGHKFSPISNYVVLMVGGEGQRLGELTKNTPKPLLVVGDKPILQTILERLEFFGFRNIILCTRYLSKSIENFCGDGSRFGLNINYFEEKEKLGTIGAVKNLENYLKEPFLVMNGDLLTGLNYKNILDFHYTNDGIMTIGCTNYTSKIPYGVLEIEGVVVKRILEKPSYSYRVSGGIYVLNQQCLEYIPKEKYFDITDLMEQILISNKALNAFPIEEYWLDIGLPNDFLKANIDYDNLFES